MSAYKKLQNVSTVEHSATEALLPSLDFTFMNIFKNNIENVRILTKIKIKERNNRQNVNICIRKLDTNKDR